MQRTRGRGPEAGVSLLETIIAVAILGIAILVIVGGMGTSILASDHHRKQADGNAIIVSAVEAVKSAPFVKCASPLSPAPAGLTHAPGYVAAARAVARPSTPGPVWTDGEITVTDIKYWDGATFGTTCHHDDAHVIPLSLQLVTVQVKESDGRTTEVLSVVKAKP
ncbi:MAG TPA: type II secretion system protein [Acidimicrobiales bacterium]|nr:type II secretion system protein [Acidimicrobiales bacterium]